MSISFLSRRDDIPENYTTPPFPSLHWPPKGSLAANNGAGLIYLSDIWRFTTIWTVIIYSLVHIGATGIALSMHVGKKWSNWKYIWIVPVAYTFVAGTEALLAGSVVGLMIGAVYLSVPFTMSTWIPFIWGWINVLILIISSFSIQGGL